MSKVCRAEFPTDCWVYRIREWCPLPLWLTFSVVAVGVGVAVVPQSLAFKSGLAVSFGLALIVVVSVSWALRKHLSGYEQAAMWLWMAGLTARTAELTMFHGYRFGVGHVLFLLAFAPIIFAIQRFERNRMRVSLSQKLVAAELCFITAIWVAALWHIAIGTPRFESVTHPHWGGLFYVAILSFCCAAFSLLVALRPRLIIILMALSFIGLTAAEVMAMQESTGAVSGDLNNAQFVCLAVVWLITGATVFSMGQNQLEDKVLQSVDHVRGIWASIAALAPLAMMVLTTPKNRVMDPTMTILTMLIVIFFVLRERIRGDHVHTMVGQYRNIAFTDALTGVGNRPSLLKRLQQYARSGEDYALIMLDVDNFKAVNDHYGHQGGDRVLKDIGAALKELSVPGQVSTHRLSGNEFAVLCKGGASKVAQLAESARRTVSQATLKECQQLNLTVSCGYCWVVAADEQPIKAVLQNAVAALVIAKGKRNTVQPFTAEVAAGQRRRKMIEKNLEAAISSGALSFAFQPIVEIDSGRVIGAEVLARWQDPELGPVSPLDFVPIAERLGLIHELGWAGIRAGCELATYFRETGNDVYVTVNVSPVQLRSPLFSTELIAILAEFELSSSALKLEVTENVFIDELDPAVLTIKKLSESGFQIALDDFGNGYSSLGYMSKIPYNIVKLDRSITQRLNHPTLRAIVQALVKSAHDQELYIIPEGVEDQATATELHNLGVVIGQGWLWSKALSYADFIQLFTKANAAGYVEVG